MFKLIWFYLITITLIANIIVTFPQPQSFDEKLKRLRFIEPSKVPADGTCAPVEVDNCDANNIFYTYDGSCNNLKHSNYGQAGHPFDRILDASFSHRPLSHRPFSVIRKENLKTYFPRLSKSGKPLPNARRIRTALLPEAEFPDEIRNALFYAFGQYSSYDSSEHRPLELTPGVRCCDNGKRVNTFIYECLPSMMPTTDEFYSQHKIECLEAQRSRNTDFLGCSSEKFVRQINHQTAFLDLSILYGNSEERAKRIRSLKDGLLLVEKSNENSNQEYPHRKKGDKYCPYSGLSDPVITLREDYKCFYSGNCG